MQSQCLRSAGRAGGSELSDPNGSQCGQCHVGRPAHDSGNRIWFPIDRGTDFSARRPRWDCNVPFGLAPVQFGWDLENPAYYAAGAFRISLSWLLGERRAELTVSASGTVRTYAAVAQAGSNNVADLTDTFDDVDEFKEAAEK